MKNIPRRTFLQSAAFPFVAASTVRGANDRVEIGFIGVGRRARWLLQKETFGNNARVVAMADINPAVLAETLRPIPYALSLTRIKDCPMINAFPQFQGLIAKALRVFIETIHAKNGIYVIL